MNGTPNKDRLSHVDAVIESAVAACDAADTDQVVLIFTLTADTRNGNSVVKCNVGHFGLEKSLLLEALRTAVDVVYEAPGRTN
jgi:hypothetical protein